MINVLQPTGDQVRAFRDRQTGEPVAMLNLLKFKNKAVYDDGRPCELTESRPHQLYARAFRDIMEPQGVRIRYSGAVRAP